MPLRSLKCWSLVTRIASLFLARICGEFTEKLKQEI